jgi:hypothetical protein
VKGRCPRPLDDGDVLRLGNLTREKVCDQMAFIGTKKPLAAGFNELMAILLNCVWLS